MKTMALRRRIGGVFVAVAALAAPLLTAVPAEAAPTVSTRVQSISATPSSVVKGKSFTLRVQAQRASGKNWTKAPRLGADVVFLADGKGQKVRAIRHITSNTSGAFATSLPASVSGRWALRIPAQGAFKASNSQSVWVKVVPGARPKPSSVVGVGKTCPRGYPIKANQNSGIYHIPGRGSYAQTNARLCFDSEASAQRAGYRRARNI